MTQRPTTEMNVAPSTTIDAAAPAASTTMSTTTGHQGGPLPLTKVKLNPQDVLLGRGDWTVRYEGNVRFRDLIREKRDLFGSASGRSARDLVASDVIRIITERGGRFLRKEADAINDGGDALLSQHESEGKQDISPIDGTWVVVDKKTAMKKVKQAFRDKDSWTQKVDTNVPLPPTAASFAPASSIRTDTNVALPPLPGALPSLVNNVNFQNQQSMLQNNAAMAENLHRLEFERTLMAAVQQQQQHQQQHQRNLSIDANNRLRQLSALGAIGGSSVTNPTGGAGLGMLSSSQQQQLLSAALASRQQFQPMTTSSSRNPQFDNSTVNTILPNSSSLHLQQQLLLLQQQQQKQQQQQRMEMALHESILLQQRSRQQQDLMEQLSSPTSSLQLGTNNWLSGGGGGGNSASQALSLQQQFRLAQLHQQQQLQQQQQINALGLTGLGSGVSQTGLGQNVSLPFTSNTGGINSSPLITGATGGNGQTQPNQSALLSGISKQPSLEGAANTEQKQSKRDLASIQKQEEDDPPDEDGEGDESSKEGNDTDEDDSAQKVSSRKKTKKRKVATKSKQPRRKSNK